MKILLINGGPHKEGCTNLALKEIEKTLNKQEIETEMIWLGNKAISGCIACNTCLSNNNRCYLNDIVNEFLDKAEEAEGFVFGSPVHFAAASGMISSFMDRAFYGREKIFRGKAFASVVSCRRGGATAAFDELNKYALISNMYVVGSSYWNQIHGTNVEEAKKDLEGLQTMRNLGLNMAHLIKCLKLAKENGVLREKFEKPIKTNFI